MIAIIDKTGVDFPSIGYIPKGFPSSNYFRALVQMFEKSDRAITQARIPGFQ